jgi:hypothetical protein
MIHNMSCYILFYVTCYIDLLCYNRSITGLYSMLCNMLYDVLYNICIQHVTYHIMLQVTLHVI